MTQENIKAKKGFTIIEVVLVLAIAGLIFLMVFVALPALQRSQRDTQRREDMSRFISQLAQYQANNSGRTPGVTNATPTANEVKSAYNTANTGFIAAYLKAGGDTFADPSGTEYTVESVTICNSSSCQQASGSDTGGSGKIRVYLNASCNGETPKYEAGAQKVAITYKLEGAGIYCNHN